MATMIDAAALRHKITLQSVAQARDSVGGITETVTTHAVTWAKIEGLSSREFWDAKAVQAENSLRFTIRLMSGVTAQMRVSWDGRTFEITEPPFDPDGRRRYLVFVAAEDVG
jgi:SPP1 family predicted phage head-tail adaptor